MRDKYVPVTLKGYEDVPLYVPTSVLRGESGGPVAPAEHIDDDGELKWDCCFEVSFAHVGPDGTIRRFHDVIGTVADLSPRNVP